MFKTTLIFSCADHGTFHLLLYFLGMAVADCGSLSDPPNGAVSVSATTYTSNATYTCDSGYTINGDSMRMCQADGEWSGGEPSCLYDGE